MKQIGSIGFTLDHSGIFFGIYFDIFVAFWSFSCLNALVLNFHQEKLFCNADILIFNRTTPPLLTKAT